jgi:hypothetical protein
MLKEALMNTASAFGVKSHQNANWMKDYYQFANRLAVLYFLEIFCSPTQKSRLVFIYFYGDTNLNAVCPNDEKGWSQYLERIYCDLGINLDSTLYRKVSNLFIPVSPYIKSE